MAGPKTRKRRRDEEEASAKRFRCEPVDVTASIPALKSNFAETFIVLVGQAPGPENVVFTIHKSYAVAKSPFFAAALSDSWREGQEKVVRLPEHYAKTFEVYANWLYTGQLDMMPLEEFFDWMYWERNGLINKWPSKEPHYPAHIHTFNLAHYLGSTAMCNLVVDSLLATVRARKLFPPGGLTWRSALEGTKMWNLMIDHFVWCASEQPGPIDAVLREIGENGLKTVATKLLMGEEREDSNILKMPRCYYHEHPEGEKC